MTFGLTSCDVIRGSGPEFSQYGCSVRAAVRHLVLENRSAAPVHYVLVEEDLATSIDLYFDPLAWPVVEAGRVKRVGKR